MKEQLKQKINSIDSKYIFAATATILVIGLVTGSLYLTQQDTQPTDDTVQVVATFYPFYDIGTNIGGEQATFETLVPPGTDPHSFDPSPSDRQTIEEADIFLVTGAEFEEWEQDLISETTEDTIIVDPSEEIELLLADETAEHEHGHEEHGHESEENGHEEHHEEHEHSHGRYDPHYWLSPQNAIIIAEQIGQALQEFDEENSNHYQAQQEEYITELENLDQSFEENLSQCEKETILITHPAFAYAGQHYDFEQVSIEGIGHLTEPTAQELQRLTDEAENHDLSYIFYDPITEADAAETIANEIENGAETLPLHSIEAVENPEEENYISLMEQNLENLQTALECQ